MLYAFLAALFFGITLIFIKLVSTRIHPFLANTLFPLFAVLVQLVVLFVARAKGVKIFFDPKALALTAVGGVFLALYTVFLFLAFSKNDISKASAIVYVGAIMLATLFGAVFLKEPFTWVNICGIALSSVGLLLMFAR